MVAALDKFHRRILAVQRLLVSDQPRSFAIITEVARIIADRTADYLLSNWKVQLQAWRDSWSNDKQPHSSVKILEGLLVEQVHHALVALTVPNNTFYSSSLFLYLHFSTRLLWGIT